MFINTTAFKRLIKGAYNTIGLTVGATKEEYFFEGGTWVIRVDKEFLPNKEKAAVIELVAEMPSPGEVFKAVKKCENQYLINDNPAWDIETKFKEGTLKFNITKAVYEVNDQIIRVLQYEKDNTCVAINEVFIGLIDTKAMDLANETMLIGPIANGEFMYWGNNIMTMTAGVIDPKEKTALGEYLSLLTNVELEKKEMIY